MSFKGRVEGKCPGCSETEDVEVWSFIRGDQDEGLREKVKSGDINVVECPHCGRLYHPESTLVYADPGSGLVAFVFPESYEEERERWRAKMREDYERMRPVADTIGLPEEPLLFFGGEDLAVLIQRIEDLEDEAQVAAWFSEKLGLATMAIQPAFARRHDLPRTLPFEAKAGRFSRAGALAALKRLVAANDRLESYRRWIAYLESDQPDPPAAGKPA